MDNGQVLGRLGGRFADLVLGLPQTSRRVRVWRDLPVEMPDGVTLLGDRYRPAKAGGALPVVVVRLPYGRAGLNGAVFGAALARRGLQVFVQSTRGTFGSGGHFRPFTTEHDDGLATLAWLRDQPWCDGRVAMTGGSYFGHTQWAVAPYADPGLVAISPHITAAQVTRAFYDHGAPGLDNGLTWSSQIGRQERRGLPAPLRDALFGRRLRRAMAATPLQAADVAVTGGPVAFWRDFTDHAEPTDRFWEVADHDRQDLSGLPPVNMVTGWWDLFLAGQLADFQALQQAGVAARILVGPWQHGEPAEIKEILRSDAVWLHHHLNGGPAPEGAPVRVRLQKTDRWLDFQEWPPSGLEPVTLHLQADHTLSAEIPPGPAAPTAFTYDPADPTPGPAGPLLHGGGKQVDNRAVEQRSDVLVFDGAVLPTDLDVVGPVRATIHLRTGVPYADVFVRVCDVDAEGSSLNVVDGIRRLHPDSVPAADVQVGADGILAVEVELFPTAYRFRAGHRLRVQIAGGAFPRFARNFGTAEPFATATSGVPCRFEIFHDSTHPTALTFTRLP